MSLPSITRKNFLRLQFATNSENLAPTEEETNINSELLHQEMAIPPEFNTFYKEQAKALGISQEKGQEEVQQEMLSALWSSR